MTLYKQHLNNMKFEGKNDKIYFEEKSDSCIMKAFKEQILKEKVKKELKNKFRFYTRNYNDKLNVPILSPNNFDFYNGYSISDTRRESNNYQKIFFRYINKHKFEEKKKDYENNFSE